MKEKIKNIVKYNKAIYKIYYYIFNGLINFWGKFLKIDNNLVLINSFGGKKYDDSPKVIYEYIVSHKEYDNLKIVWALDNLEIEIPGRATKVKNDSLKFFKTALKAKYWITNSSMERGLSFKKRKIIELNTWHGSTMKKMASENKNNKSFKIHKGKNASVCNIFLARSEDEAEFFSKGFEIPLENMFICGLPRNDILINVKQDESKKIKEQFCKKNKLPIGKKIILYAPTFREYLNINHQNALKSPIDIQKWKKQLGDKYILLFRAHYETAMIMNYEPDNEFTYDMSKYDNLNELMIASDILISDYSSIINDWALLEKPIIDYAYDFNEYQKERGVVEFVWKNIPNVIENEDEIVKLIQNMDYNQECKKTIMFNEIVGTKISNSTERAVKKLFEKYNAN